MLGGRAGSTRVLPGRILKPKVSNFGYQSFCLSKNNSTSWRSIHTLVLDAFVGPRPDDYLGCHNDGDPFNNCLDNLRWDTPANNSRDAVMHGTQRSAKGPREFEYEFETLDGEEWRPVAGYEDLYEVSSFGRVKIVDQIVGGNGGSRYMRRGHLKRQSKRFGYLHVHVAKDGKKQNPGVHVLVLEAFVGPRPDGTLACHNDGNPSNNRVENLRWDSRANNGMDTVKHDTHPMASKTHCINGHEYTPENTMVMRSPRNKTAKAWRQCSTCQAEQVLRRRPLSPNGHNRDRTHCPQGHEYTPENTTLHKGKRSCRTCRNDRKRAKRAAERQPPAPRPCEFCGELFSFKNSNARHCSHACRAATRRKRLEAEAANRADT